MTAAVILLSYCVLTATVGRAALRRWAGARRAPVWGIVAWQALSASSAVSFLLAGVCVAVPLLPVRSQLAQLASTTPFELTEHYQTPVGAWPGYLTLTASAVLAAAVLIRTGTGAWAAVRVRHRQRALLRLVGEQHPDGYVVVAHESPLLYCLPGRGGSRIVVSSSARDILSPEELRLAVGHERRHLRARHDLALVAGEALVVTFRRVPLLGTFLATAREHIAALAEMSADDAAAGEPERRALARALVVLASGHRPSSGPRPAPLGSRGADLPVTADRVRRLVSGAPTGLGPWRSGVAGLATVALLAAPLALALAPAVEAATRDCCAVTTAPGSGR